MPGLSGDMMPFSDDALFGKDDTPRIVAVHPLLDGPYTERAHVRVYSRSEDFEHVVEQDEPFYPFFFLSDIGLLHGFPRQQFRFQRLAGDNFYRYLVVLRSWPTFWETIRHVERAAGGRENRSEALYVAGNPVQQYLMQSGRTSFKGMTFDDLHRLQLDIEVRTDHNFPNASRPDDAIIIAALHDNRGWRQLLHLAPHVETADAVGFQDEASLLRHLVHVIRERDPDVIEGHNVYAFDLAYILARCERLGIPFAVGRDGSEPRTFPSSMRFAERVVEFPAVEIAGRHVIDTYFQVMAFDVFKRDLPGYGLKEAARYFGLAPEDRTYVAGSEIGHVWRDPPERLLAYALDDVRETERLARHLSGSTIYLAQMVPMPYGQVARTGPAAKIEALFVREYLRQRHSLPRSEWGSQALGGYTDVFVTGVVGPVVYADVESLYPSIMLHYGVKPKKDHLNLFPELLRRLTDLRLETKQQMRQARSPEQRGELDARQSSYKILINCFTPDTEVLTADGLKRIGDVRAGDLVYALDPATLEVHYKPVVRTYHQEQYTGPVVRLENPLVDFAVTPNHHMLTSAIGNRHEAASFRWREAGELTADPRTHTLPPSVPFRARACSTVLSLREACDRLGIPYAYDPTQRLIYDPGKSATGIAGTYDLADWLRLAGWYLKRGVIRAAVLSSEVYAVETPSVVSICFVDETPDERAHIRALLDRFRLPYVHEEDGLSIEHPLLVRVLSADFGGDEKRLPAWIWDLDGELVDHLFQTAYLDHDGLAAPYRAKSRDHAAEVVRLAFHCGRRARLTGCASTGWRVEFASGGHGPCPALAPEHRRAEPYDGPIVCLEVADYHTLLCGRKGKLNWCGQSFYGQLGFSLALFNDFSEADRVAATGQQILRQIIQLIRREGGQVIEVDTDGVLFVPPEQVRGEKAERAFVDRLNAHMPEGIRLGFDGRFCRMLSYKKKNYALLDYEGKLRFKGSSLVSRSIERFGRRFVREAIRLLMDEDIQGLHDLYLQTRERITAHDWKSVKSFSRTETLKDTVEQYLEDVAAGRRTKAAAYELAIRQSRATGRPVRKGDRISYYVTGSSAGVTTFENCRLAREWDPAHPDENTAYYLKRLDEFARKFEPFFSEHDFRLIFSPEDLFGFSPAGIRILRNERSIDDVQDEVPF